MHHAEPLVFDTLYNGGSAGGGLVGNRRSYRICTTPSHSFPTLFDILYNGGSAGGGLAGNRRSLRGRDGGERYYAGSLTSTFLSIEGGKKGAVPGEEKGIVPGEERGMTPGKEQGGFLGSRRWSFGHRTGASTLDIGRTSLRSFRITSFFHRHQTLRPYCLVSTVICYVFTVLFRHNQQDHRKFSHGASFYSGISSIFFRLHAFPPLQNTHYWATR
ncbi:hypothetical protein F4680DRAFT_83241 [Xylaria scruposa]|nr:hypothetical protein F4680DRAFT_83241 [Xylaria scruposa]